MSSKKLSKRIERYKKDFMPSENRAPKKGNYSIKILSDLIAGLLVGIMIGLFLDKIFDTWPFFFIIMMPFGFFIGYYIFYKDAIASANKEEDEKNSEK